MTNRDHIGENSANKIEFIICLRISSNYEIIGLYI